MKSRQEILEKLWKMDRDELLERSRQEFGKRSDTLLARFGFDFVGREPRGQDAPPGSFFFGSDQIEGLLQLIRQRLPQQVDNIIARANKICAHRFDLLGYHDLDYGESIDWHLDQVHGISAPRKPFYRVKYLDFEEVGDSKVTWELNRHQHLVILAKAYRLTGDERYANEIHLQWRDWHSANPYPLGINWASSLELAFRSLSWIWVYQLLNGTPFMTGDFRREWHRAQALNGRHIERYLSTYFSANTHLLGEAVALFFLGTLCGELSGAPRWKALGWRIILEQARRQVNPDGLHFERSIYYHVYTLDMLLHAAILHSANGQSFPQELTETLERMLNALFQLSRLGPPPRFGDDDGGRLFDPSRNRALHLLDPLAAGAVLFRRGDFKHLANGLREETIWLLGQTGVEIWDTLEARSTAARSEAFEGAGIYVLAADCHQLMINGAPSAPQSYGHAHADALSLCLQSEWGDLLIDSGTCEYVGENNLRGLFRGTAMHNTLQVDGKDQADQTGPFSWKRPIFGHAEQWIAGESFSLFVGRQEGYQRLQSPVLHRRWVVALKPGIFLVRDLAVGQGEHRLDVSWHLGPELQRERGHLFRIRNLGQGVAILPVQEHGWSEEVRSTACSPVYGKQLQTAVLSFATSISLPAEFATLLVTVGSDGTSCTFDNPGTFTNITRPDGDSVVWAYRYESPQADYRFFFGRKEKPWKLEEVSSDAEFLCMARHAGTKEVDVILSNGSFAEIDGRLILRTKRKVSWCEMVRGRVVCSDADKIVYPLAACPVG
jgi:hypothetical protein